MSPNISSQRGVALLTILLLVVSITVVAGAMLASQKTAIRRSGLLFDQNQLLQDIASGQQLAVTLIRAESKLNDTDSQQDIWAQPIPPYALGNHSIALEFRDEASRFNINNLYHDGEIDTASLAIFQRLLTQLNLEPDIAIAVLDWQDADGDVYEDGGDEATVYTQQAGATAGLPNQPFNSIEQLMEVRGVKAEVLMTLRPYISAVPYYLPININTASPEVLASLIEGTSVSQMQPLITLREQQVIKSIDDILAMPPLNALAEDQREGLEGLVTVESQAFTALITATDSANTGQARQRFATVLISKINSDSVSGQAHAGGANNAKSEEDSEKKAKTVTVLSQRLWAFRPSF